MLLCRSAFSCKVQRHLNKKRDTIFVTINASKLFIFHKKGKLNLAWLVQNISKIIMNVFLFSKICALVENLTCWKWRFSIKTHIFVFLKIWYLSSNYLKKLVSYQNFRQIQTCMQSFNDVPFVVTEVHRILCHILGVTFYDLKIQNGLA